jgi:hypothetical protein
MPNPHRALKEVADSGDGFLQYIVGEVDLTLPKKKMLFGSLLLILAVALTSPAYASPLPITAQPVVYDSVPRATGNTLPGNIPSLGFECCGLKEVGNIVTLTSIGRELFMVTVVMSDWACQSGDWTGTSGPCVSTPGSTYSWPITLNLYDSTLTLLASKTVSFNIPFRPSADATRCPQVGTDPYQSPNRWYDAKDKTCYNGYAFSIDFDFSGAPVILTSTTIVFGITYNTRDEGYNPTGVAGPSDSLNVGLDSSPPQVGTNPSSGVIYLSCDNTVECASPHSFGPESGWATYTPAVQFRVKP